MNLKMTSLMRILMKYFNSYKSLKKYLLKNTYNKYIWIILLMKMKKIKIL